MLDMSRAFDTIQRGSLIEHLRKVLDPDELHLICLLIKDVTLQVKCDGHLGRTFRTNIGSPQGDCASPILFIFELSVALEKSKRLIKSYAEPYTISLIQHDHQYSKGGTKPSNYKIFSIAQEYADDCSVGSTETNLIDSFEETVPDQLAEHNLGVNRDKTQRFSVKRGGDPKWKDVILLGSKLDTTKDISRRKGLSSAAWTKYSSLLTHKKLPLLLRIKYFETFVSSIFLYQCGIWTLDKKLENNIDVFQRRFLRRLVGIYFPRKITNKELYKITNTKPWSETCKLRRLTLFRHICRLPEETPAKQTIIQCMKPIKRPVGRPKKTLIKNISDDF